MENCIGIFFFLGLVCGFLPFYLIFKSEARLYVKRPIKFAA